MKGELWGQVKLDGDANFLPRLRRAPCRVPGQVQLDPFFDLVVEEEVQGPEDVRLASAVPAGKDRLLPDVRYPYVAKRPEVLDVNS